MKRSSTRSGVALLAVTALVSLGVLVPATTSFAQSSAPAATGASERVIVVLRDQHSDAPASKSGINRRSAVVSSDQAPVIASIHRAGGRTTHAYKTLNAVAATVPAAAVADLRSDPAVASVVPDLLWKLPTADRAVAKAAAAPAAAGLCPTDSSKPLLEPEALELTHTASDTSTAQTARSLGYDGTGVKVGFIADGLDIDQPDFIRADGSHVITDYQDFSGDGTDADTAGGEAFGDASSIAAQGREKYDISTFVNAAHPLPAGCTIRVQGMAPGASMVALKVFSNALLTAPTSTIIQAIDWAVNVDHVDVLNESFGSNPYPDNATDPISAFNHDAVDAGVTVVASTGDAGGGNTLGTASTDPWVIAAGATTSEQVYAQQSSYGFQLGNGRYVSNQLSSLSSGGISETRRVLDLLAPGDLNWALCSDKLDPAGDPQYGDCGDDNGNLSNLQVFGGTSESAPLTAGAAALVIQAYRKSHVGSSPTPAAVRQILDSSADDLGLPADLQGAGLLNSYRAVQLAANVDRSAPKGQALLLDQTQVSAAAAPGTTVSKRITVTNQGAGTQRVTATLRKVSKQTGSQTQQVMLSATAPTATFVDAFGLTRSYVKTTFTVPVGTDLLATTISWPGAAGPTARVSLLDPQGTFTGYSLPQGPGNFGRIELHTPAPGKWTAIVWTSAGAAGFTGPVTLRTQDYQATSAGSVTPSSFTLAPGARQTLTVRTTAPDSSTTATSLVLTGPFGQKTTASVVVQAVQRVRAGQPTSFKGTFVTANGRDFSPGQTDTYLFDVPSGAADLDVRLDLAGVPATAIVAHLSDPSGEPISTVTNQRTVGTNTVTDPGLQIIHATPRAGIWQLTLELLNPVAGAQLPVAYRGTIALNGARVTPHGVPTSTRTVISARKGSTQRIKIVNTGPAPQTYFIDPRLNTTRTYPLTATQAANPTDPFTASIALPLPSDTVPAWLVPTEGTVLTVGASATDPITFDVMPLDSPTALNAPNNPDIESNTGIGATAVHTAAPIASALWAAFPSLIGPTPAAGATAGSVDLRATITAKTFYPDFTSSTGDPLLATVTAAPPTSTPVTVPPGGSVTITLNLKPTGPLGSTAKGHLYVDTLQTDGAAGLSGYADETAAIPFAFTVGR